MRAWDQIEIQLLPLFNSMLGTHQNATHVLLRAGINQPTLRDILNAIASFRLRKADQNKLASLLRCWKSASTKRNRIVHGSWTLSITMIKGPSGKRDHTKSAWVRFYYPSDPAILHKMMSKKKEQKLTATHQFTIANITRATDDVRKLAGDIHAFTEQLTVLPFVDPQPIELEQQSTQTQTGESDS